MSTIQEFLLKDIRCFKGEQRIQIRPLTLLVGKNSTGKSTVLGCFQTLFEYFQNEKLNFNLEPYNMGSFTDILCKTSKNNYFVIGFKLVKGKKFLDFQITFTEKGSEPVITKTCLVIYSTELSEQKLELVFKKNKNHWTLIDSDDIKEINKNHFQVTIDSNWSQDAFYTTERVIDIERLTRGRMIMKRAMKKMRAKEVEKEVEKEISLPESFIEFTKKIKESFDFDFDFRILEPYISMSPIRSKPKRTYDPLTQVPDPEGADIPMYLADLFRRHPKNWQKLQEKLNDFGKKADLFDGINIKIFSQSSGDPFQVQLEIRGVQANFMDVGYGVSQLLPILVRILNFEGMFLIQQPEVHLHPQGQAAFASLLTSLVKEDREFLLETHSDYIINRVRLEIRKKNISPNDVSLVFHEPQKDGVKIHNITFDEHGNFENLPAAYRDFFLSETNSMLGIKE